MEEGLFVATRSNMFNRRVGNRQAVGVHIHVGSLASSDQSIPGN